ncbi:MAG: FtsQ-type POTRA domain-containing protein [Clostridiales Family XIII bacterium]|jgi:cell division protein FtsQ|nr:FtsQ-type POTRA domain-containing protein [Clostridiales Family XIII bacterium]
MDKKEKTDRGVKKKRKKKHLFLNIIVVVLILIGLYFLATSGIFAIEKIMVKSSGHHFTDAKIADLSGIKKSDNLWKTRTSNAEKRLERNPYIANAKIKRKLPDAIEITINEREENYAIAVEGGFAVLDWSGIVLRHTNEALRLPLIEGVEVEKAATGSAIVSSRDLLLSDTVKLLENTNKAGLYFKRVRVTDVGIKAYIYDTLSVRGRLESVDKNLDKVKLVMLDLAKQKIKRGTIIVGENGNCTFSPEKS